ncbi:transposase [Thiopseudomonas alkaliphila]|mgnify:CR=1 FL=1|nr:hypothetical protein [Thiopseudomonas alkaliphila]MDM1708723.1 transposase [Thiopseudomonas alkaliphila]
MATVREHYDTSAKALNAQRHWDLGSKVDSVIVRIWGKVSHCLEENTKYWSFYFPERAEIGCIYYLLSQPHVSDGVISHDEPAMKVVYLAIQAATKKWTMPIRNWKPAMNRFMIEFGDRLNGHL